MTTQTLNRIELSGGIELEEVTSFSFTQEAGRHARAQVSGVLQGSIESKLGLKYEGRDIAVKDAASGAVLFSGLVEAVSFREENGYRLVELELVAGSSLLDNVRRNKSYQNVALTYEQVVLDALADQPGSAVILPAEMRGCAIGAPLIRYGETAWEFVSRLASHFGHPVISDVRSSAPRVYIGVPDIRTEASFAANGYTAGVGVRACAPLGRGQKHYIAQSERVYSLGANAGFNGRQYAICAKYGRLDAGMLELEYLLAPREYCRVERKYNGYFAGMTLLGRVIKTAGENVYLHLDIDAKQSAGTAYAYPWVPESGNLMYLMPQVGTRVSLYFANEDETQGRAINCIRENGPQINEGSISGAVAGAVGQVLGGITGAKQASGGGGGAAPAAAAAGPTASQVVAQYFANPENALDDSGSITEFSPQYRQLKTEHGNQYFLYPNMTGLAMAPNYTILNNTTGARFVAGKGGGVSILSGGDIRFEAGEEITATTKEVMYLLVQKFTEEGEGEDATLEPDGDPLSSLVLHYSEEESRGQVISAEKLILIALTPGEGINGGFPDDPKHYNIWDEGELGEKLKTAAIVIVVGTVIIVVGAVTFGAGSAVVVPLAGSLLLTGGAYVAATAISDMQAGYASDTDDYIQSALMGLVVGLINTATGQLFKYFPNSKGLLSTVGSAFVSGAAVSVATQWMNGDKLDAGKVFKDGLTSAISAAIMFGLRKAIATFRSWSVDEYGVDTGEGASSDQDRSRHWTQGKEAARKEFYARMSGVLDDNNLNDAFEAFWSGEYTQMASYFDTSSPVNGAVFWSKDPNAAKRYAELIGGVMLETTPGGSAFDGWDFLNRYFDGNMWNEGGLADGSLLWKALSSQYAQGASGSVFYINPTSELGRMWETVEFKIILELIEDGIITDLLELR